MAEGWPVGGIRPRLNGRLDGTVPSGLRHRTAHRGSGFRVAVADHARGHAGMGRAKHRDPVLFPSMLHVAAGQVAARPEMEVHRQGLDEDLVSRVPNGGSRG